MTEKDVDERNPVVERPNLHDLRRDVGIALEEWANAGGPVQEVTLAIDELIQYWVFYGRE